MPTVPTSVIFPNAKIDNQGIFIPLTALQGVSLADAASLKFALDKLFHDTINKLPIEQQPTNLSVSQLVSADGMNASYTSNYRLTPAVVLAPLAPETSVELAAQQALGSPVAK